MKTAKPEENPVSLEGQHRRRGLLPDRLVGCLLVGSVVLSGCSEAEQIPGTDRPAHEGSEATLEPENGSPSGESASREGLIDVDGGYTQEEQLAELEIVVEVMREHFGDDVATIDGERWTAERHDTEVAARPRGGDKYRHAVNFDLELADLEEAYATADEIAKHLGLTENVNNSNGVGPYGRIYYGAGREEGRVFILTGDSPDVGGLRYRTRHSDDESLLDAYEHVLETNRQEREAEFGPDNPRQMEDLERHEDEESSD
ncbi:hypothetical protein I2485_07195 [Nesterenkonia sp. E16_7]|uniref:hypothetical protein n=1 Tax=unclassified Nesterenkonia TaxID=2629769 RepID=UPI001A91F363|nr:MULTISPECIES: hypothetical protein [unclassified Nesterenkonia]MBO0594354.1 hypothetical protein [Nesterenkonia sp. E16_10]MBO0598436.1 hypothetical protein [Nesterenkonia sp. E16_7]